MVGVAVQPFYVLVKEPENIRPENYFKILPLIGSYRKKSGSMSS